MIVPVLLVIGAILGMAGTFVSSVSLRGLCWGLDGVALVVAAAMLAVRYFRQGHDMMAAGFLVFVAGQALIVSSAATDLLTSVPVFGAGTGLWAASLIIVSVPRVLPAWVRATGAMAALLFAIVAISNFAGRPLTPLSRPLPFFAYPFLVATLLGWASVHRRNGK